MRDPSYQPTWPYHGAGMVPAARLFWESVRDRELNPRVHPMFQKPPKTHSSDDFYWHVEEWDAGRQIAALEEEISWLHKENNRFRERYLAEELLHLFSFDYENVGARETFERYFLPADDIEWSEVIEFLVKGLDERSLQILIEDWKMDNAPDSAW